MPSPVEAEQKRQILINQTGLYEELRERAATTP